MSDVFCIINWGKFTKFLENLMFLFISCAGVSYLSGWRVLFYLDKYFHLLA